MSFGNVIVPLVTPKKRKDFFPLIDHILSGGVKDLVLFGTTGEGGKIDQEEKKSIIRQIVPFINERARLYIGLMDPAPAMNIELANFCQNFGFAAALLPTTYMEKTFDQISMKVFLYHLPDPDLDIAGLQSFKDKKVIGIKDSSGTISRIEQLIKMHRSESFRIYYGREYQIDKALTLNIDGIFPASGNIQPQTVMHLWEKRDEEAFKQFANLKKSIYNAAPDNYILGLKNILTKMKIISEC